jgi:putative transcriptional regulator
MAIVRMTLEEIMAQPSRMDKAKVAATTEGDIERHSQEDGEPPCQTLQARDLVSPAAIRKTMGMTQAQFARTLRIPLATLRNWEQERVALDPAVLTLMRVLAREPQAVLRAFG